MQPRRHFRRTAISTGVLSLVTGLFSASLSAQTTSATNTDQQLAPVVVQSTHIDRPLLDTPASVSIVDGDRLKTGAFQVNLSENLVDVPGLLIKNRNNYAQDLQISIRGFGSRSTFGLRGIRLYVDNIPQTMPDGQGQSSNIDIASIDHIEVLRGPFSALYGNSSGGVMQVFTKPGEGPLKLGATVATGSNGSHKYGLEASGGTDNKVGITDYRVSTSKFETDGFREHSAATRYLSNARIGIGLGDDSNLVVTANSVYTKADDPLGLTPAQYRANPKSVAAVANQFNTRKTLHQTQAGFDWTKQINADNQLEVIGYGGQRSTVQYQSIPYGAQQNPNHSGGVIDLGRSYAGLDARWTSNLSLADRPFTVVTGLAYDWMKENRKGYNNYLDGGNILGVEGALRRDERNTMWNLDPYIQTSWQVTDRLDMDLGARYSTPRFKSQDYYLSNGDNSGSMSYKKLLPMGAIHYALTKEVSVYATAGKGFETPTMSEFSYSSADGSSISNGWNYALKPAVSNNVEVGTKANTNIGNMTLAVFATKTDNDIVPDFSSGGRSVFQNADTKRKGVELSWDKTFLHHAHVRTAYTWLDAKFKSSFNDVNAGNRIPGIGQNMVTASVDWTPPEGFLAGAQWQYMAKMYADNQNTTYAPSYTTTSLYTGYRFNWDKWEFGAMARVDNVFDKKYVGSVIVGDSNGRYFEPADGRNWMVSVSANYHF